VPVFAPGVWSHGVPLVSVVPGGETGRHMRQWACQPRLCKLGGGEGAWCECCSKWGGGVGWGWCSFVHVRLAERLFEFSVQSNSMGPVLIVVVGAIRGDGGWRSVLCQLGGRCRVVGRLSIWSECCGFGRLRVSSVWWAWICGARLIYAFGLWEAVSNQAQVDGGLQGKVVLPGVTKAVARVRDSG